MRTWGATKAKAQFSAVLDKAETEGPQLVQRRKKRFILLTEEELTKRTIPGRLAVGEVTSGKALWDALRCPPEDGIDTDFPRLKGQPRKVTF